MESALNAMRLQMLNESLTLFMGWQYKIKDMRWMLAMLRYCRKSDTALCRPIAKTVGVTLPDSVTGTLNEFALFKLGIEKRCQQF